MSVFACSQFYSSQWILFWHKRNGQRLHLKYFLFYLGHCKTSCQQKHCQAIITAAHYILLNIKIEGHNSFPFGDMCLTPGHWSCPAGEEGTWFFKVIFSGKISTIIEDHGCQLPCPTSVRTWELVLAVIVKMTQRLWPLQATWAWWHMSGDKAMWQSGQKNCLWPGAWGQPGQYSELYLKTN